jgi:hypothetical protein
MDAGAPCSFVEKIKDVAKSTWFMRAQAITIDQKRIGSTRNLSGDRKVFTQNVARIGRGPPHDREVDFEYPKAL